MKLHPSVQTLVNEIEAFRHRSGWSVTRFGQEAVNDTQFLHDIRKGRVPSLTTIDRVRAFIAASFIVPPDRDRRRQKQRGAGQKHNAEGG